VSGRARTVLTAVSLAVLGFAVVAAVLGLPDFGEPRGSYGHEAVTLILGERQLANTVVGITFDLRGIDTLGEELILFCAAIGTTLLLRAQREEGRAQRALDEADEARERVPSSVGALGAALVGPVLLLGLVVLLHGTLSPGGGFQGGVVLAAALLMAYAAGQLVMIERVRPISLVEVSEALGAGAFVLIAIGGLVFSTVAMANFLPFASLGSLLSGGTVPLLNLAVGLEVAGALTLILTEFVDQALLRHGGG
jgi:multicomponent Na+:H+ antiporter subunit B